MIELFLKEINSFTQYQLDMKTKGAVERHIAIIGEAVNQFLKESPDNSFENAVQIVSVRNRLIHAYDSIDDSIIWSIITLHLQSFKEEVSKKIIPELPPKISDD